MSKKPTNLKSNADQSEDPLMREARSSVELSLKKPVKVQRHCASGCKRKQVWMPIETATWDVLSENDQVILNGWNGTVRFANVVDVAGQVDFEDEYGVPLMAVYDGYTHWMPLPKPPTS